MKTFELPKTHYLTEILFVCGCLIIGLVLVYFGIFGEVTSRSNSIIKQLMGRPALILMGVILLVVFYVGITKAKWFRKVEISEEGLLDTMCSESIIPWKNMVKPKLMYGTGYFNFECDLNTSTNRIETKYRDFTSGYALFSKEQQSEIEKLLKLYLKETLTTEKITTD